MTQFHSNSASLASTPNAARSAKKSCEIAGGVHYATVIALYALQPLFYLSALVLSNFSVGGLSPPLLSVSLSPLRFYFAKLFLAGDTRNVDYSKELKRIERISLKEK